LPRPLGRSFYERDTVLVAKELLGRILERRLGTAILQGIIVETEAYRGTDDPASHAYRGLTPRNRVMFGPPGHAYVYFTYGMHHCLNVTTEPTGEPGAVLIRAIQPTVGIARMQKERRRQRIKDLTNGPAKLTEAFSITRALNGHDLTAGERLFVTETHDPQPLDIESSSRIGVRLGLERDWRFFVKGNLFVSRQ